MVIILDEEAFSRKNYRRDQPLIDDNILQRTQGDLKKTETTDILLRRDKNKMELMLNPIVNAEIFKGLERNEFVFLPNYETTNTDQKILFDIGVQLQFAKKSSLLQLLSKELLHYAKDFPLECLLDNEKIIEQLILFGNSNDLELKSATVPLYERLLKKMLHTIEATENPNLRKALESLPARNHINSLTDNDNIRISYPSLDNYQFTKEAFQHRVDQSSTKVYSLITLLDAIVKNSFNLCTEELLTFRFVNLIANYIVPLMTHLYKINMISIRKLILGYIGFFRRLMEHTNLKDPKQVLFLSPAIKVSTQLLRVIGVETIKVDEFMSIRGYFVFLFDAYLNFLVTRADIKDCLDLAIKFDKELRGLAIEVDRVLISLEYVRETETEASRPAVPGAYLSDQLDDFKKLHAKLMKAVGAISFTKQSEGVLDLYLTNHLKTVLLKNTVSESVDPEFNHYSDSVKLLSQIVSTDSEVVLFHLLISLSSRLDSSDTIGFPGSSSMVKDLTYSALMDNQLASALFVTSLGHPSPRVIAATYDLLFGLIKKCIDRKDLDRGVAFSLLPFMIRDAGSQARAKGLLELLIRRVKKYLLFKTFLGCFVKDRRKRGEQYSHVFRPEFFDQCLSFTSSVDFRSPADCNIFEEITHEAPEFPDPLEGIVDQAGNLIYSGRLSIFKDKEQKLNRISQAQIKSLYDLVSVALNENLEYSVRCVALDQICEALYFYKDSTSLKEFCTNMISICEENLNEFGNNRENFSMIISKLRPLDESFISTKTAKDLPLQNKHFQDEKSLAFKYLEIFNVIVHSYPHLGELRRETLHNIFNMEDQKGICRALWIMATERDVDRRFQAFLTLNMIFLGNMDLHKNLGGKVKIEEPITFNTLSNTKETTILKNDFTTESTNIPVLEGLLGKAFCILFSGYDYSHLAGETMLRNIDESRKDQIIRFIDRFISEGKGIQGKYLDFGPNLNKEKLESSIVDSVTTSCIEQYTSAFKKDKNLDNMPFWVNCSLIGIYIQRTDFLEPSNATVLEGYLDQMKSALLKGEDETFITANNSLLSLVSSREFKSNYHNSSVEQSFLHTLTMFYHEKILPVMYEYHVEKFAEKYSLVSGVFTLMKETVKLTIKTNDQKLLVLIRGFITRQNFLEFLCQLLRRYEAMDILSTVLVSFLRWHFDLFLKKSSDMKYIEALEFLFDSALICNRTDNFFGMSRLISVLKLAHAMCCRNAHLTIGGKKAIFDDVKQMGKEEAHLSAALKTSTIAWIVSLLDHRSIKVRMICWNIVCSYLDGPLLELFPSLVESSLATLNLVNESAGVLSLCIYFLFKVARLVRTIDAIGSRGNEENYTPSKIGFVKLVHDRRGIDTFRRILAEPTSPDSIIASSARFLIEWVALDFGSIQNKYFQTDFLEKIVTHLKLPENECREFQLRADSARLLCERMNKATVLFNFLNRTTIGNNINAKVLLKNFSLLPTLLDWIDFSTTIMKQQVVFEVNFSQYTTSTVHLKSLEKIAKELCLNCLSLVETLYSEADEMFYFCLNDHEGGNSISRQGRSIFSTFADVLTHDSGDEKVGMTVMKLIARILLKWSRGFELIDSDECGSFIAENLISRCMSFFKNIDYTKINDSDYLNIITSEELLNILAILISRSELMKDRFLTSGLFSLYVNKFLQIIQSFKKQVNMVTTPQEKKAGELYNVTQAGVKGYRGGKAQTGELLNTSLLSNKLSSSQSEKGQMIPTKTAKLNHNIQSITKNSVGHIKAYIQIAKCFFHASCKTLSPEILRQGVQMLEGSIADLMAIVNFLWTEGQFEEVIGKLILGNND